MKTVRWFLFIPIAIITSALFAGLYNYFLQLTLGNYYIPSILNWVFTGILTCITFYAVAINIAPKRNNIVKWVISILILIISLMATMGTLIGTEPIAINSKIEARTGFLIMNFSMLLAVIPFVFVSPDKIRLTTSNTLRWLIALSLMLLAISYTEVGVFYFFEFVARKLNNFNGFLYTLIWLFLIGTIVVFLTYIFTMIYTTIALIVRQPIIFLKISSILMFLYFGGTLILYWVNVIDFSWEQLHHKRLNAFFFSLTMLSLLYIPLNLLQSAFQASLVEKQRGNMPL